TSRLDLTGWKTDPLVVSATRIVWSQGVRITAAEGPSREARVQVAPAHSMGGKLVNVLEGLPLASASTDPSMLRLDRCYAYAPDRSGLSFAAAIAAAFAGESEQGKRLGADCVRPESEEVN